MTFLVFYCHEINEFIEIVGYDPVFETGLLFSGEMDPADLRRQLSRWTKAARVVENPAGHLPIPAHSARSLLRVSPDEFRQRATGLCRHTRNGISVILTGLLPTLL
jgi:hypothetical protein